MITVGELVARFLEQCGVKVAFGVISIHNMPMLDALHRRGRIHFVPARGEAGACNMADASARVAPADLDAVDANLRGHRVQQALAHEGALIAAGGAIRAARSLVGEADM
eukprot:gene27208-48743_t